MSDLFTSIVQVTGLPLATMVAAGFATAVLITADWFIFGCGIKKDAIAINNSKTTKHWKTWRGLNEIG